MCVCGFGVGWGGGIVCVAVIVCIIERVSVCGYVYVSPSS